MADNKVKRRLAAIVAADVVGYSILMGRDEEGTLSRLKRLQNDILKPNIKENGGRLVKTTGDGMLIEFASAVDAVSHGIDVQSCIGEANRDLPEDQRIFIRMGINVGDVIIEDEDIYGDGVNIAARLETLAEPGGICISSRVYDLVAGRFDIEFESIGAQSLKNIDSPIVAYQFNSRGGRKNQPSSPNVGNLPLPDKPSIAVLPFDNLGGDPEQEYFSDGMTDDIITDLSKIPDLFVIARNSSFVFKGQVVDAKEIGRRLGVRYLLEGSVRRAATKIRINAQLIDTATHGHIWADRYDGSVDDIFSLQDEMTSKIVDALELAITEADKPSQKPSPGRNGEVYDLFLKARRQFYQFTPESVEKSKQMLESVLRLDADFAEAYSLLSYCQFVNWNIHMAELAVLEEAHELARKAADLDPNSGTALARLGWVLCFLRRYDEALAQFQTAVDLSPSNAEVYAYYGETLNFADRPEEGLKTTEQGIRLDPLGPPNWDFHRGHSLYKLQKHEAAISAITQSINRGPNFPVPYLYLAVLYAEQNRLEEAKEAVKSAVKYNPLYRIETVDRVMPHQSSERRRFLDGLRKAGLPE